jgi:Tfp pilus assembly protein PilF
MNIFITSESRIFSFLLQIILISGLLIGSVTADPSFSPDQGKMPLKVKFSFPGGENCDSVIWTFEDGKTASEINPTYTYTGMGFHYPTCVCTLPGATITYSFGKIVSSNADMPDADTTDKHYPVSTAVDIKSDTLSLKDQVRQATGLYALGQYDYAASSYQKAVQISGSDPDILAQYGTVLAGLSRWKESAIAFNQSAGIKPDPVTFVAYGGVLTHLKKFDEALAAFNRSLELDTASSDAWAGIGEVFELLKQNEEAAAAYRKSLDLDQKDASVWKGYGNILNAQGKDTEAVDAYGKAISLGLSDADMYLKYGGSLRKIGRDGEAQAAMDKAKSLQGSLSISSYNSGISCTAGGVMG